MKRFRFQLESVLQLQRNECDLCREVLADAVRHDQELSDRQRRLEGERANQLDTLRRMNSAGELDVHASLSYRTYIERLASDLGHIVEERRLAAERVETCRKTLLLSRQSVESLEKLSEKRRLELTATNECLDSREREDTWQSLRAAARAGARSP
jgi:flagellar export protein FliJ